MAVVTAIAPAMSGLPSVDAHPVPGGRPETGASSSVDATRAGAPVKSGGQPGAQEVRKAVRQANIDFAGANQKIGFTYEEKLGQLFVQVLDKHTGKVIKEIPPKEFIRHQVAMREFLGLLLDRKA